MANQTAYLDDMLRWSLDWLMKASLKNSVPLDIKFNMISLGSPTTEHTVRSSCRWFVTELEVGSYSDLAPKPTLTTLTGAVT